MSQEDASKPENANEGCPGVQSDSAGKSSACDGCPNQSICSSGAANTVDPDIALINERMAQVKNKILVLSGKGGVGKSTITTMLSYGLALDPEVEVGVVDVDLCGPSIPKMFGVDDEVVHQSSYGWSPVWARDNIAVISIGFMLSRKDDAVIWRGPKKNGLIKQFLRDVNWERLDWLLLDTPPGTSDEHLSIIQFLKEAGIDGAVIVTTPQEVSLQDVRKEINFCRKVGVRVIGLVENMAGYKCPNCQCESTVFPSNSNAGAMKMCEEMNVPYLAKIALDPRVASACDQGKCFFDLHPNTDDSTYKAYIEMINKVKADIVAHKDNC